MTTKPTIDSINSALTHSCTVAIAGASAQMNLHAAKELFQSDVTGRTIEMLRRARADLISLRRTQTAALENIDAAIESTNQEGQQTQ